MGLAARLQQRLDEKELSQAELAKRVGVATQTIWKLATGNSTSSRYLHKIARELGTTVEYLTGETNDASPGNDNAIRPRIDDDDLVLVDSIDLSFGMGGTFLDDEVEVEQVKFSRTWLRQFTSTPPHLLFSTRGIGDSMTPTIQDRDVLIVDRGQTSLVDQMNDKIWAITFGGLGMVKRLRKMPDGTVKIMSDNPLISPEVAGDGELYIVGRVVARVSTL